ncbi:transcriptional regulator, MarR family [Pseudofrankia inefficax]|uniref:Transcriptional regulator, MarR family n=2 Tax=Pseudofrankia inefficax (strain DSM 45817 / CECT 9037 / DDB 130130 / EuI1c) TaxID=298654 RepID=E3IY86_PSEI1|nr:transcriptional regulator, MarR family [Pseudofrankia inefficax]
MSRVHNTAMATTDEGSRPGPQGPGAAFLLAQLGAHATGLFARRVAALDLTPPQAGLLRLLAVSPGRSQRELADDLGMPPSRFVPFADELEERGLIERRRNPTDRRLYALHLTGRGTELLAELRTASAAHEQQLVQGLAADEHRQLTALLNRIAEQQGLTPGVHPGYRSLPSGKAKKPHA